MPASVLEGVGETEHELVAVVRRPEVGLHAILAVHSTVLGPALGGCRLQSYPSFGAAASDALRLSRTMTAKAALAGLALGGGKAVVLASPDEKTPELLDAFADAVHGLGGRYITAEDVGTTTADMDRIRLRTPHVTGTSISRGGSGDPSPATALGVLRAMEAGCEAVWESGLAGRRVLVIGVGKVGGALVELLVAAGAEVVVSDVDRGRVERALAAGALGEIASDAWSMADIDVLSPCALGGALTAKRVAALPPALRLIVGAANNQLASPDAAHLLAARGVLYVPDYLANAGGIINIAEEAGGYDPEAARRAVERIGETTRTVLARALQEDATPLEAADRMVVDRLERAQRR